MTGNTPWFGVHLGLDSPQKSRQLISILPELAALGVNVIVGEVNYSFAYVSYPELRAPNPLSQSDARALAAACRANAIRLIPQFQCLGHQSWMGDTFPLLARYPDFDETPGQYPNNAGIYCRSWCPRHPLVNPIVFTLIDELLEVFEADAIHVGLDEVFLIASPFCPRCRGADAGELFGEAVNAYSDFLVKDRGLTMLVWGDRLLDDDRMGYGEWEAAQNGTHTAIAQIPRHIVVCDWHYEARQTYPSLPFLIQAGFRVWPAGWKSPEATEALLSFACSQVTPSILGHLCTTWGAVQIENLPGWRPLRTARRWLVASGPNSLTKKPDASGSYFLPAE